MSLYSTIDRFDYIAGSHLFWSEHHSGQGSDGYARLSRYIGLYRYNPGACFTGWESLSECARDVYRAWCDRENERCEYDGLRYRLESADFDCSSDCAEYLIERYEDCPESLQNYDRSDFVNCDMPYTRDLLAFYERNDREIKDLFNEMCDVYGHTSTLQALEGETIDDPEDMAAAMVNHAMTYLARTMLDAIFPDR